MRRSILLTALFLFPSVGCEAIFHFGDYSTTDVSDAMPGDVDAAGVGIVGVDGAVTPVDDAGTSPDAAIPPECRVNADCDQDGSAGAVVDGSLIGGGDGSAPDAVSPSVCVKPMGKCARLLTAECPRVRGDYRNDDAILLGTMLATSGDVSLEQAAWLATDELNSSTAGGLPPAAPQGPGRPLVVVSCDIGANVLTAAKHLVDVLHVPAIVGPRGAADVATVTQQVSAKGGSLILTPTSLASSISALVDDDLTWRDVASDVQRAKLVIEQMNEIESVVRATRTPPVTVKLGMLYSNDAAGTSARDAISGTLLINGHFISDPANAGYVTLDSYANPSDTAALAAIATRYSRTTPDIIYVTAAEQVSTVVVPLEQALTLARATIKPYYVCTDAVKSADFLTRLTGTNVPSDIRRRIRGVGARPDTSSASTFGAFDASFEGKYGPNPNQAGTAAAYDAMYAVTYAIAATPDMPLSGTSVARGLRSLGVGDAYAVGPTQARVVMQNLAAGRSVSLRGTFSLMQWDPSGDILGGTVEVWCVGAAGGPLAFGSSGLTMDVQTQVVGGAFVQCQ